MGGRSGQSVRSKTFITSSDFIAAASREEFGATTGEIKAYLDKGEYNNATIMAYTYRGYLINNEIRALNRSWADQSAQMDAAQAQFALNLDRALNNEPNYVGTVWRGIRDPSGSILARIERSVGGEISWPAYSSTSKERGRTSKFSRQEGGGGIVFKIRSKTGKDISTRSVFPSEKEVLFKRNSRFRILSVSDNVVTLEEI